MKPILIDAIYINMGGALTVLNRLIDGAVADGLEFVLLKDARCPRLRSEDGVKNIVVLPPSLKVRHKYYRNHMEDFHSVLCMSNVPPTVRMPCKVHTYFHNLSVLMNQTGMSLSRRLKNKLKKQFIRFVAKNTDSWIVQTWNTENLIKETLPYKDKDFYCYPIYTIPKEFASNTNVPRKDYLFVGEYTMAKGHDELLAAWYLLHNNGIELTLHLTCSEKTRFLEKVNMAVEDGLHIVNHGFVKFQEMATIYQKAKAIVYPSFNESLGLGIVEGLYAGCDIVASDLPFVHAICNPSEVFNPHLPESIASAIMRYEEGKSPKSMLTINDCMKELLRLITE